MILCSVKKVFLEISQNSQEITCARVSFLIKPEGCNFIKKETLAQVFSSKFSEISKNTFFTEHLSRRLLLKTIESILITVSSVLKSCIVIIMLVKKKKQIFYA